MILQESAGKYVHVSCGAVPELDHEACGDGSWRGWFGSCGRHWARSKITERGAEDPKGERERERTSEWM